MDPFRSWYQNPAKARRSFSRSPSSFGVPVYNVDPNREFRNRSHPVRGPPAESKLAPNVIRIPVQFFRSDSNRRLESALKIQKVFRGYLVRKNVRKIKEIEFHVDEIGSKLSRGDVVEIIMGNERERLRMNENLMNLLLKLDGIRGVDLGVRVFRKGVTRKAIALQERIDSIVSGDVDNREAEIGNQESEIMVPAVDSAIMDRPAETLDLERSDDFGGALDDSKQEIEGADSGEEEDTEVIDAKGAEETEYMDEEVACDVKGSDAAEAEKGNQHKGKDDSVTGVDGSERYLGLENFDDDKGESWKRMEVKVGDGNGESEVKSSGEAGIKKRGPKNLDSDEDNGEKEKSLVGIDDGKKDSTEAKREDGGERTCKVLEKMMEENGKMMQMMIKLSESNEVQVQMLNALTNRVEYLEKAYLCDKLRNQRRKKKRNKAAAAAATYCGEE